MSRPPLARERVLDAFQAILIDDGERTATLAATAEAAGVSKGGLLYHFASRDDLVTGMLERLEALAQEDLTLMASAEEGEVAYFIRTSVMEGDDLDRALIAAARLAQAGFPTAAEMLRQVREAWAAALRPHVRDETALNLLMLVSDGLYYNNALGRVDAETGGLAGPVPTGDDMTALIELVRRATV